MRAQLLIILSLLSADLFSQETKSADSVFFYEQRQRHLEFSKQNATLLLKNTENQIGKVSLIYDYTSGNLKNAQMPASNSNIQFSSDGIRKLGRLKLYGDFTYSRIKDHGLGNSLRGEEIDDQPFYYFAEKESEVQRQKYHANGIISYELIRDKIYLSSGFNYIYYLADRSIDPRISLNWFDFIAKPELTWINKHFHLGLSGLWGYGVENTALKYKNKDYSNGVAYPDRITYLNYGYGYTRKMYDNFSRRKQYKGLGIHLATTLDSWNTLLNLDYKVSEDANGRSLESSLKNQVFSTYQSDQLEGQLLLTKQRGHQLQQIEAAYSTLIGEDYLEALAAKNYTAKSQMAYLSFSNMKSKGNHSFEWGLHARYRSAFKKDAVTSHLFEYSYLQPGLKAGYYQANPGKYRFSAIVSPSLILPLQTIANVASTQVTEFTTTITYPDYAFRKITSGRLDLKLQYINQTLSKDFRTGITLNAGFSKALDKPEIEYPSNFLPGEQRFSMNLSLNLYF
ncbi:hypothetical protein DBR43_01390 [Pedobacter sp. KBW06]|uniref:DUF6850 family outer membrane beta-barrel protein n=1 Tax=Pedobacter sp. KBW06 TaxID=2153359 RepID=UPI000F5902F8|nr:DUF6850 family outer membrane beta-barrel protein [Pedobacter sp. KBW06]RQO74088.1 hypothetical protein DBR43_01390 [Pedobacter sp. KBW06]